MPALPVPYPERVLTATITGPRAPIELHTTQIPPGVSNGWIKVDTLEGIYRRLARPSSVPRILCGDFNTLQVEQPDGRVVTWAERVRASGAITIMRGQKRWDQGERDVLEGLRAFDLPDMFRLLHGYGVAGLQLVSAAQWPGQRRSAL